MNKTNRAPAARTKSRINKSPYSAPGITSPPGLTPMPNTNFRNGIPVDQALSADEIANTRGVTKPPTDVQKNTIKLRHPLTADEVFLREILHEGKTNPLSQEKHSLVASEVESITDHSFASMVWPPLNGNGKLPEHHGWPDYAKINKQSKGLEFTPLIKPDKRSEVKVPKVPELTRARRNLPLTISIPKSLRIGHGMNNDNSVAPRAWSPPPAFIPGMPFQTHTSVQLQSHGSYPDLTANSGSFPPGKQIEGLRDFSRQYPMHGRAVRPSQFRTETRYPYAANSQEQDSGNLTRNHVSLPEMKFSKDGMNFRPAETANAAIAQLHSSMSASQLRSATRSSNKALQRNQFVAVFGGYVPPNRATTLGHGNTSTHEDDTERDTTFFGDYEADESQMDTTDYTSPIYSFGNLELHSKTRGVYIRNVPPSVSLSQICDNIRGGAIDRISFHEGQGKADVAVYFVLADAAKAYKHWTNRVGGIWWNPANHSVAFPSFTTFIGPEDCGHDRLKGTVKASIASEGATRCILIVGLPGAISGGKAIQDLKKDIHLGSADVESVNVIDRNTDHEGKTTLAINFASIETALSARKFFAQCQIYKDVKVLFAPDHCAGPILDLAEKWNRELYEAEVMNHLGKK